MTRPRASLVCFATGEIYEQFAAGMFETALGRFFAGRSELVQLATTPSWPDASRDRYRRMLDARRRIHGEWVFLIDADMRFEGPVDEEVLAPGITAALHPAQNGLPPARMTFERDPASVAYVAPGEGSHYYVGAFVGGRRAEFFDLCREIARMSDADYPFVPVWWDESYLNRLLIDHPPALALDERYCAWWNRHVPDARIRALDKTPDQYAWRAAQTPEPVAAAR